MTTDVEVVVDAAAELGEGPVWDERSGRLAWVDIVRPALHQTDVATGATETIELPDPVGVAVPRSAGGFLAALPDGFYVVGDGPLRLVAALPDARRELRFNDGKCDPAGRFWGGTLAYDRTPIAAFYRLDPTGEVTRQFGDVTVSNGLAWSPDTSTMYYIDSSTRRVDAFDFDVASGSISGRRTVVEVPPHAGKPDGMTIDAEGGLWIAMWGGSAVHRYVDGRLDHVVRLPVSRPTSCAFGGPDLDELFITSGWSGLDLDARRREPTAGALFRVRPGARGLPPMSFAG